MLGPVPARSSSFCGVSAVIPVRQVHTGTLTVSVDAAVAVSPDSSRTLCRDGDTTIGIIISVCRARLCVVGDQLAEGDLLIHVSGLLYHALTSLKLLVNSIDQYQASGNNSVDDSVLFCYIRAVQILMVEQGASSCCLFLPCYWRQHYKCNRHW